MENQSKLQIRILDDSQKVFCLRYELSKHAVRRFSQRGITQEMIKKTLLYGEEILKQGLTFYYMCEHDLACEMASDLAERIADLVVVVDENHGLVLTAYRSRDGRSHILKKTKQLFKHAA